MRVCATQIYATQISTGSPLLLLLLLQALSGDLTLRADVTDYHGRDRVEGRRRGGTHITMLDDAGASLIPPKRALFHINLATRRTVDQAYD